MSHSQALVRQVAVIAALCCLGTVANAAPSSASSPTSSPGAGISGATTPRFAVGAGISWAGESFGSGSSALASSTAGAGLGGLGGLSGGLPLAVLSGEFKLSPTNWLMTALSVGYSSGESATPDDFTGTKSTVPSVVTSASQVAATLGVRHIHNPGSRVEVSGYVALSVRRGASSSDSTSQPDVTGATTKTVTARTAMELGAVLGLAFDTQLSDSIWLRFSTPLLHGAMTSVQSRRTGDTGADAGDFDSAATGFGLRFSPTMTLRMVF